MTKLSQQADRGQHISQTHTRRRTCIGRGVDAPQRAVQLLRGRHAAPPAQHGGEADLVRLAIIESLCISK